jgi:hypothetical protein
MIRAVARYYSGVKAMSVEQNTESIKMVAVIPSWEPNWKRTLGAPIEAREGLRHH